MKRPFCLNLVLVACLIAGECAAGPICDAANERAERELIETQARIAQATGQSDYFDLNIELLNIGMRAAKTCLRDPDLPIEERSELQRYVSEAEAYISEAEGHRRQSEEALRGLESLR